MDLFDTAVQVYWAYRAFNSIIYTSEANIYSKVGQHTAGNENMIMFHMSSDTKHDLQIS